MTAWYMTPAMVELLRLIRLHEGGKAGYNADFRNDDHFPVTSMTLDQTIAAAKRQVAQGEPSSAIGGYQFLSKTLEGLKRNLKLKGSEIMTPAFQDDLAVALMNGRGHMQYLRGEISAETFANNLAKEWASLPMVSGAKKGRSYYAGDGLNKSFHSPETILAAVRALKTFAPVPTDPEPVTPPVPGDGLGESEPVPSSPGFLSRYGLGLLVLVAGIGFVVWRVVG